MTKDEVIKAYENNLIVCINGVIGLYKIEGIDYDDEEVFINKGFYEFKDLYVPKIMKPHNEPEPATYSHVDDIKERCLENAFYEPDSKNGIEINVKYDYLKFDLNTEFGEFISKQLELLKAKSNDYANEDILSNFKLAGKSIGLTPEQQCLSLIATKVVRLGELFKGKEPKNESINDSLIDLANYTFLLSLIVKENGR